MAGLIIRLIRLTIKFNQIQSNQSLKWGSLASSYAMHMSNCRCIALYSGSSLKTVNCKYDLANVIKKKNLENITGFWINSSLLYNTDK